MPRSSPTRVVGHGSVLTTAGSHSTSTRRSGWRAGSPLVGNRSDPRVVELYECQLRLHILPVLGAVPMGKLTTARVRSWHADLVAHGPGPSTAAKCYRLLRAILNTAVEDGLLTANPCRIKGGGVERAEERPVPSIAQVYALADAVPPRYRVLVLMAAFGGLRPGELFGLTRRDIAPLHRMVTVSIQRQENVHGHPLVGAPRPMRASARSSCRSSS